eukprot:4699316-Amphidinium_carterae.2
MPWQNDKGVQDLINSYKACQILGIQLPFARRGASQQRQQAVQPGSKRWSAQQRAGWNCPKCTIQLWVSHYLLRLQDGSEACRATFANIGSKEKIPYSITKPWEQLEHQLAAEKNPEVKALLQQAANLQKKQ